MGRTRAAGPLALVPAPPGHRPAGRGADPRSPSPGACWGWPTRPGPKRRTPGSTDAYLVLLAPVRQIRSSASVPGPGRGGLRQRPCRPPVVTGAVSDSNAMNKAYLTLQHLLACRAMRTWRPTWPAGWPPTSPRSRASAPSWPASRRQRDRAPAAVENVGRRQPRRDPRLPADDALQSRGPRRPNRRARRPTAPGSTCCGPSPSATVIAVIVITVLARHALRGGARAVRTRGRAVRPRTEDRLRGEPADRTRDVEGRAVRLRSGGRGPQPGRSGHAVRAAPGRFQQSPLPPGARQHRPGRRRRVRGHVPRRLPRRIEGTDHGVPRRARRSMPVPTCGAGSAPPCASP